MTEDSRASVNKACSGLTAREADQTYMASCRHCKWLP
jgi:hypothetical protein